MSKCGTAEQSIETYCRNCGIFLPDFEKPVKKETSAEDHIKANSALSLMTAIVSLALAITLYVTLGFRAETPRIIYLVAAFLLAITAWQVLTFIRTRMLRKQLTKLRPLRDREVDKSVAAPKETANLLDEGNLENAVPASVTEDTTRILSEVNKK